MVHKRSLIFALALGSAGCSPADDGAPRSSEAGPAAAAVANKTRVSIALLPPQEEGHLASLSGRFAIEGDCLYLRSADGKRTLPAFAMSGVRWDSEAGVLSIGGARVRPGDGVTLTGAMARQPAAALRWLQAPAPGCDTARIWIAHAVSAD